MQLLGRLHHSSDQVPSAVLGRSSATEFAHSNQSGPTGHHVLKSATGTRIGVRKFDMLLRHNHAVIVIGGGHIEKSAEN